jgi:arylsulfatase A-like enzyme
MKTACFSLFALTLASVVWGEPVPARPNIILIMSDDMGFSDLGCYGGEIETPVLDGLAEGGLRFTQFYNMARCCPTRASLLTGLYPHQAGMGHMTGGKSLPPAYMGNLNRNSLTIAEMLRPAGYATYMTGKWHVAQAVAPDGPKDTWPLQRGFDKFYGTITGAGSFFDPTTLCRGNDYITPENDAAYQPEVYYYTDAISDNAIEFLRDHNKNQGDKPFFLYVSYTAAHWPMHALPEDIAKYKGRYDEGYAAIREARLAKARKLGLVDPAWTMTAQTMDWDKVEHKDWEARCMEVYAAMVDRMDQGIGKIMEELKAQGDLENTIVFFLQDNGGCAEGLGRKSNDDAIKGVKYEPLGKDGLQRQIWPPMQTRDGRVVRTGPGVMPGPADTYIGYGEGWANVSNTPFREYKHWVHEGGISTPLIVHWPAGMRASQHGSLVKEPGHLIDIAATCVEVAKASYPQTVEEKVIHPLEGVSLVPAMQGEALERKTPLFFEHEGNRAVRDGAWKLVAKGPGGPWELYNMELDRTETVNLADKEPERRDAMVKQWEEWAKRTAVIPWIWKPAYGEKTGPVPRGKP